VTRQLGITASAQRHSVGAARARMLAGLPLDERRVSLAGASTAVLEGGEGPPLILLHGGIECGGAIWAPVVSRLAESHRVVIPDLPGLGESGPLARLDAAAFTGWVRRVRARVVRRATHPGRAFPGGQPCRSLRSPTRRSPAPVGALRGAWVGRYRMPIGLRAAAVRFALWPSERNAERFDRWAFFDFAEARCQDPEWFAAFSAYTRLRAAVPQVKQTMSQLLKAGTKQVADAELGRIKVPTVLLWGRQDHFVPLGLAEAASNNLGWPLHVIDDTGHVPHIERSDAFLDALQADRDAAGRS